MRAGAGPSMGRAVIDEDGLQVVSDLDHGPAEIVVCGYVLAYVTDQDTRVADCGSWAVPS